MRNKKTTSCKEQAIEISIQTSKMMSNIIEADLNPAEDTALLLNMECLFLKQIMYNTAIIADYVIDKELKGGTN